MSPSTLGTEHHIKNYDTGSNQWSIHSAILLLWSVLDNIEKGTSSAIISRLTYNCPSVDGWLTHTSIEVYNHSNFLSHVTAVSLICECNPC